MIREQRFAPDKDVANAKVWKVLPVSSASLSPSVFYSRSLKLKIANPEIQGKGKHLLNRLVVSLHRSSFTCLPKFYGWLDSS